jgi:type VI secretion system protein ImpJ
VDAAVPGIELIPEAHPPAAIPVKAGYKYFRFILQGDLWHQILQEKFLAIHMPTSLPGLKIELLALGSNLK